LAAFALVVVVVLAFGTAALVGAAFLVVDALLVVDAFLAAATLLVVVLFLVAAVGFLAVAAVFFLTSGVFPEEVGAGAVSPTEASSTGGVASTAGVASVGVVSLTSGAGEAMTEALSDMASSSSKE